MEYNIILEVVHWMYNLDNNNTNTVYNTDNNNKLNNIINKMRRKLESDTRLRYLLGNNPMGELIRITQRACINKKDERKDREVSTPMGERNP